MRNFDDFAESETHDDLHQGYAPSHTTESSGRKFDYAKIAKIAAGAILAAIAVTAMMAIPNPKSMSEKPLEKATYELNALNEADVPLLNERLKEKIEIAKHEKKVTEIEKQLRKNSEEKAKHLKTIATFKQ